MEEHINILKNNINTYKYKVKNQLIELTNLNQYKYELGVPCPVQKRTGDR